MECPFCNEGYPIESWIVEDESNVLLIHRGMIG